MERDPSSEWRSVFRSPLFREGTLLAVIVALGALLQWRTGQFLESANLTNLLTDAALLSFCAVGAGIVILSGGLDISLGSIMALSAGIAGSLWEHGQPLPIVLGTALFIGAAAGMLNAGLSLLGRVHPIVVTLGTMSLYRGLTLWWLRQDVQIPLAARSGIMIEVGGLPLAVWGALALVIITWAVLNGHVGGRQVYALGGNPLAARRVGIRRVRVWLTTFTVQGMLAGFAGWMLLARAGSLQATSYEDKTLEGIAAAVVGGVAITGGRGSVWGIAFGCLFLVMLGPACLFLHISANWQRALVGAVMVAAVTADTLWRRRAP